MEIIDLTLGPILVPWTIPIGYGFQKGPGWLVQHDMEMFCIFNEPVSF